MVQPPPEAKAIPLAAVDEWIDTALGEADAAGIRGKAVTPFLLESVSRSSRGRTLETNLALLESNARLAARIASRL